MLTAKELVESREKPTPELPSFGVKDFEPDGSTEQLSQINQCVSEIKNVISHPRVKMLGVMSQAAWRPELNLAEVIYQTGSYWTYMGHTINQKLFMYPEEALYLLEIGALELTYNEVPLSIQRAYFILLQHKSDTTIEKYRVYSQLNANGYKVLRHSPLNTVTKYEKQIEVHKLGIKLKKVDSESKCEKRQKEEEVEESNKRFKSDEEIDLPVVYIDNDDERQVLKKMQIFEPFLDHSEGSLNFDFDIYTESSVFKKSCLQLPNYRVIVHRSEDPMPDLTEICRLAKKFKDEVPAIHAIVFPDHVAFYEINPVVLPDAFDC